MLHHEYSRVRHSRRGGGCGGKLQYTKIWVKEEGATYLRPFSVTPKPFLATIGKIMGNYCDKRHDNWGATIRILT